MKKIIITIGLAALVLIGFSFYWISIRPSNIKKQCFTEAKNEAENMLKVETDLAMRDISFTKGDYEKIKDRKYDECLQKNGFSK